MTAARSLGRSPARADRFRLEPRSAWVTLPSHEWHHFIVFFDGGTLLVNFSREARGDDPPVGRVIVLHHDGAWRHGMTSGEPARVTADGLHMAVASHRLDLDDQGWSLRVGTPDGRLTAALRFTPAGAPLISRNSEITPDGSFHWIMYPDVEASGTVRLEGVAREVQAARAYHDHNWGQFAWGDDFGWEWGIVAPSGADRTAVVCTALTDRSRSVTRVQQLFLWSGGAHVWTARGSEIRRRASGRWPTWRAPRIPAALSLATPPAISIPPREVDITATDGHRRVDVEVRSLARAQVLIPDERRACGVVALNECVGTARLRHSLDGALLHEGESPCVYEVLEGGAGAG